MFCSNCGANVSDNAKFCGSCGKPAASTPVTPSVSTPIPTPPPTPAPSPAPAPFVAPAAPAPSPAPFVAPAAPAPAPTPYVAPAPAPVPTPTPTPTPYAAPATAASPVSQPAAVNYAPGNFRYRIFGENLPGVAIKLNPGESVYTQSGGMVWMDNGITMSTNMEGGLMKGLGRMFTGESLFMATFTSNAPDQELTLASAFPGSICHIELNGNSIIAQKDAFLCAQPSITLSLHLKRSLGAGLFGGEGFILQKMNGFGHLFLEIDGSLVEKTLKPGEVLRVGTGNVAAFDDTVRYEIEMVKGFKNVFFGGEGLFISTLTGPGKVWLQTMNLPTFAKQLIPYLPKPSSN